jgi:hypothetical protein
MKRREVKVVNHGSLEAIGLLVVCVEKRDLSIAFLLTEEFTTSANEMSKFYC